MATTGSQPIHGNYHGYYTKRPFVNDPRLALLSPSFFSDAVVLDVGCNEGWVTCEIAQQWKAKKVIGVDIDPDLIRAAWRRRKTVWSLQEPNAFHITKPSPQKKRKRQESVDFQATPTANYFPLAMEHMFASLPIIGSTVETHGRFPQNISFHTADWTQDGVPEDTECYDVVLALSLSKWVHINGGDAGLMRFFRRVSEVLKPGGKFVLEPQAWDTYAKAKRMDPRLKETANSLRIRPEGFPELLEELGLDDRQQLGTIGEGGFRRPVDVYIKR